MCIRDRLKGDYPSKFDIRGEIILTLEGFAQMNKERLANGEEAYMNPRNTVSGSLKLQDSTLVANRPLECLLYSIVGKDLNFDSQFTMLVKAREWGFKVPTVAAHCKTTAEVMHFVEEWDVKRHDLPYETDGVVVKVNSLRCLLYTSPSPRDRTRSRMPSSA